MSADTGETVAQLTAAQREMVAKHRALVERVALDVNRLYPGLVELDELRSLGHEGLVQAARRYDSSYGVPFPQFAKGRVRGAMLDGIRGESRQRRDALALDRAVSAHVAHRRVDFDPLHHDETDAARGLGEVVDELAMQVVMALAAEAEREAPEETLVARETTTRRQQAIVEIRAELSAEQQRLLELLYDQGATHPAAAAALGISVATLFRKQKALLQRMAALMAAKGLAG